MIEFRLVEFIDAPSFSQIFADSLPALRGGGFWWEKYPEAVTDQQKEALYASFFEELHSEDGGMLWEVLVDGIRVMYNAGTLVEGRVYWRLAIVGRDQYGSSSFFYRNDYPVAEKAFWVSLGVTSHVAQITGPNTPIHLHYLNRASDGKMDYPILFKQYPEGPPYEGFIEILVGEPSDEDEGFIPFDASEPAFWRQPVSAIDAIPEGAVRSHEGKLWESTVANNVWEPGVSGWREYVIGGVAPWQQPTGAHDAYSTGERVTHDNPNDGGAIWVYESAINANTTEPGRDGTFDRWWTPVAAA